MKTNIKKIIPLICLLFISTYSFAKVEIDLKFTDVNGVGFKAPRNKWMMDIAQEAVELIGGMIKQDAQISIEIKSNFNINCAVSHPKFWHIEYENGNQKAILEAHSKILNENTVDNGKIQGQIEFNTNSFTKVYKHFLRRTVIHELTHLLGFIPWKMEHRNYPSYNDFDKLLHDGNGNCFLIEKNNKLSINPDFDCSSGLYACGPNIQSLNDGSITIYCPKKFECGSSYAHLDPTAHPLSIMNPRGNLQDYPLWNECELGILQDLGYKIDWNQYDTFVHELTSKENQIPKRKRIYLSQIDTKVSYNEDDPSYRFIDRFFDSVLNYFIKT